MIPPPDDETGEGRPSEPPPLKRERQRFPKAVRLTRASEFRRVKDHGRSWGGRFLVFGVLPDARATPAGDTHARTGFVTSRRVGGAVDRNRVRRRLREIVRQHRPLLREGCWLVVIARHTAARATSTELAADWLRLARRAGILQQEPPAP